MVPSPCAVNVESDLVLSVCVACCQRLLPRVAEASNLRRPASLAPSAAARRRNELGLSACSHDMLALLLPQPVLREAWLAVTSSRSAMGRLSRLWTPCTVCWSPAQATVVPATLGSTQFCRISELASSEKQTRKLVEKSLLLFVKLTIGNFSHLQTSTAMCVHVTGLEWPQVLATPAPSVSAPLRCPHGGCWAACLIHRHSEHIFKRTWCSEGSQERSDTGVLFLKAGGGAEGMLGLWLGHLVVYCSAWV